MIEVILFEIDVEPQFCDYTEYVHTFRPSFVNVWPRDWLLAFFYTYQIKI